ncbi:uncharacterized protein LOC118269000 isoform X1 [Spodoptera frugiperda]|uniref:Uncharacterized protein LOC118269000 isoform X1 n=1 Tax=Spodoptera frugiperda TaxID=7108 RepID=A0A9R0D4E8_SPOFR|nr:uncharacterized protein LOC118269000 isoform X1 [Spodoptera frugiperda]
MSVRRLRSFRVLLVVLVFANTSRALVDEVLDVLKLGKEVGEEVLNSWDVFGKPFNATGGVDLPVVRRREREIMARLAVVSRSIEKLEISVQKVGDIALFLAKKGNKPTRLELRLHEMSDLLNRVAWSNRQMREYVGQQENLERSTLQDFAEWCVSHDPGALPGLLERVHALVVPPHKNLLGRGLLQLIMDDLTEEDSDVCDLQMSPHQLIYDMYNTIALTEIKGYAMMQFSWMLLRIYGRGNFTQEASLTRQRYSERTGQTATAARAALAMSKRDLYRCDPPVHTSATYAEVTRLLQGYVENEVDMNGDATCKENCAFYTLTENHGCYMEQFCYKQDKCRGRIIDCQYLDSDMWVCPASRHSQRRYEWIEYENGRTLGRVGSCRLGATKVDSWWRWTLTHCSYCFCLCEDEASVAERFFSLREVLADINENKVVTGMRLVKLGKVFHIQIYQGKLVERGFVESSEEVLAQAFDPEQAGVLEGVDYHTLTYERRAIDLDELDSPSGHVLTGARFRMIGAHLHFEIRATPFNYTTGKLHPEKSQWISNDNTEGSHTPRTRLELYKPDLPTRSHAALRIDSQHDQYIEFTHSDFDADAAQSTVPFIDVQPVVPSKALNTKGATLLSGAGLYHRGARGSGGFIGVKVITYDYSKHVKAEPPPSEFVDESETTEFVPIVN